jgi:hypothetical protein
MVAVLPSNAAALEHVLLILLDQPVAAPGSAIPPFRACFLAAGVANANDFVSVSPDAHGSVEFSISTDGSDAHFKLNVIQIKKLRSLVDWFSQVTTPPTSCWFDLTKDAFRSWRTSTLAVPTDAPTVPTSISPISEFLKGVKRSVSNYKPFKEDWFFISWQRHLKITARSHNVDSVINLSYVPSTPDAIALLHEQQKFFFSVFEQTVLTPDGLLIICKHSDAGDATVVCSDLIDRYGKPTAAELAANDLENDLIEFRMDASPAKPNSAFLLAWTAKSLDLDAVSPQPIGNYQKHVWFTCAVAPRAVLSMAISHFDTSEQLASRTQGSAYVKADFSVLYEHVMDVAACTDQTDKLIKPGTRRAHEANVAANIAAGEGKPVKCKSAFVGKDGERHSYVMPPEKWIKMTPPKRTAALAKIRADKGLPPKAVWQRAPSRSIQNLSLSDATETMTSYVEVANPNSGSSVVSGVTQQSSAEPPPSSTPSLCEVLTSTCSPASGSSVSSTGADSIVSIGRRFYRQCQTHSISYNLSNHASSPVLSSLIDGGDNGGMAGNDVHVISKSSSDQANVTGVGESVIQNLPLATVAGLVDTHCGPAIVLLHQCANYGKGHTVHLSSQL